jgi:hypothetical protein
MPKAHGPQIVDSENVVSVGVSVENSIQSTDAFANGLFAEVGSGVDQDKPAAVFDEH